MLRSARLIISDRVKAALTEKKGVVALESTVITHGLPYPQNLETAKALENEVRKENCEPATIALLNGNIHVGLTDSQLLEVADTMDSIKVSRRDIPYALNKKVIGGTTVAATMYLANLAGIRVFATGGIGGVHRGADKTFDISADLIELARTPVAVVCAGVKSILDIPKTVEFLETHSVNNIVYGQYNEFPGFFTQSSGCKGQLNTMDLNEVASIIELSKELNLSAGTLLACPIPKEFEGDGKLIEDAIQVALKQASLKGIKAQKVTPFILKTVNELTKGASMKTNIALLKNNAKIGAQLAKILAVNGSENTEKAPIRSQKHIAGTEKVKKSKVTVIGAVIVDLEAITHQEVQKDGGSYEGVTLQRCGGVGRNHADALSRLGIDATLISAVGNDSHAKYFFDRCSHMDLSRITKIDNIPTASYCSINVKGDIWFGVSSIGRIVDEISSKMIFQHEDVFKESKFLVLDGNIPIQTIKKAIELAEKYGIPVWFDPTDYHKACKIIDSGKFPAVHYISPNINEFKVMATRLGVQVPDEALEKPGRIEEFIQRHPKLLGNLEMLLVSMAERGTVVFKRLNGSTYLSTIYSPPVDPQTIVSASGAGDCLNSGIIAGLLHGFSLESALKLGQKAAGCALKSTEAVPETLNDL